MVLFVQHNAIGVTLFILAFFVEGCGTSKSIRDAILDLANRDTCVPTFIQANKYIWYEMYILFAIFTRVQSEITLFMFQVLKCKICNQTEDTMQLK